MKIFIVDWETTGVDVETLQPLQFAIMYLDTKAPFPESVEMADLQSWYILHDRVCFDRKGLPAGWMNAHYFRKVSGAEEMEEFEQTVVFEKEGMEFLSRDVAGFMRAHLGVLDDVIVTVNIGGKNAARFDVPIMEKFLKLEGIRLRKRVIDPSVFYVDWEKDDCLPDLHNIIGKLAASRFPIVLDKAHNAVYDVWNTALAIHAAANRQ